MATRALSRICKSPLIESLSQTSFISRSFMSIKHSMSSSPLRKEIPSLIDKSRLFPMAGLVPGSLGRSVGLGSIAAKPHCQSSLGSSWSSQSSRLFSTSGVYPNMTLRFNKQRRNRGEIKGITDNHISFGKYGLEALEPAWITAKQITAGQLAIKRNMKGGKLFLRIFPHKPVSLRPAETRMGRGKGNVAFWVAGVRAGRILFEIDGVPESVARRAISVAASKMPIKTRFVKSLG
ncbi:hypothetical protein RND81_09G252000 [Saponaria officinalis]|uniref:Ribosomal protein L16 n=1 Tax=Saponaria officinalis TaxID=3572 RepID=A0AAW1IS40_SAPOF